jgi:hypothetical protein
MYRDPDPDPASKKLLRIKVDPDPYPWTYTHTISKNPRTSSLGEHYRRNSLSLMWSVQEVHKSGRGKVQQVACELLLKTI